MRDGGWLRRSSGVSSGRPPSSNVLRYRNPMTTPAVASTRGDRRPAPDEISLVEIANSIFRRRRLVAWSAVSLFALVVTMTLLRSRVYTAGASFIPQAGAQTGGLSGIAAQFGLAIPAGEATQSPEFYASLVRSREVLGAAVDAHYAFRADSGNVSGNLLRIFRIDARDSALRREKGIQTLGNIVSTAVDKRTGVVTVNVTTSNPMLSFQIVTNIVEQINLFNLNRRQARAAAERQFMEQRLAEVQSALRSAEDRLQSFLQSNREYRNSSVLIFQADRLTREVSMQQQVYTTLSQGVEQARIEAVRDTPLIMAIEKPSLPARPDPRGLLRRGLLAFLVGLFGGMVLAAILGRLDEARHDEPGRYGELASHSRALIADLRRPWRLWGRAAGA